MPGSQLPATRPQRPLRRLQPDLVVLDPADGDNLDFRIIDELHRVSPDSRLVILTALADPHIFNGATLARIHGYFLKGFGPHGGWLLDALALIGEASVAVLDPAIPEHLRSSPATPVALSPTRVEAQSLSGRELEVLRLLLRGLTDHEIATDLSIAVSTVERHVANVSAKLGATTRVHLGALAARLRFS